MKHIGIALSLTLGMLLALPQAQAQTYTRTDTITYEDNLSKWVLGQVKSSTNVDTGLVESRVVYDPVTAMPLQTFAFEKLQQTLTYNADGTLATVKDGRNNSTTLSIWKRGIPQSILYADNTSESAVVNDDGTLKSVTDENGFTTSYTYDAMGRLASITHPTGDSTAWNNTTIVFERINFEEYGLPAGHWRQHTRTGNYRKYVFFDALWRPVVEQEDDFGQQEATLRWSAQRYDHQGRTVFSSYPRNPFIQGWTTFSDPALTGTSIQYDALGRVKAVQQDSEHGKLTTTTKYLAGHMTEVKNPRGQITLTAYRAYDQPTYDQPHGISELGGDRHTEIYRDVFGKPYAIRRRNGDATVEAWRHYVYDQFHQLCKTIEPETGATVMAFDEAGNLGWTASGLNLPSRTDCDQPYAYWSSGRKVQRLYDARNRLTSLTFPDGRGDQAWTYTLDGLPATITTYNDPGNTTPVINAYTYNKRRLLTGESSAQPGWYSWGIGYGYNSNGHLQNQSYPTGLNIDYAPNALGQPTRAGSYATGVSYHPNGAISQFTYGNGIVHSMQQNARLLPAEVTDSGGALSFSYRFDRNANVEHIWDHARDTGDGFYGRWMAYDGLDRLTDVGSCSFGGDCWHRFTYDALDNIRSWKLGGVKDYATYYYEPGTNRLTNILNSNGASVVGLGYDPQGNLANKNGQNYIFDYGNRLREVTGKEYYRYDGLGRRVLSWRPANNLTVSQYSQSGQLVFQWNDSASKYTDYVYIGGSLIAAREAAHPSGAIATKYQHTDALGSPVAVSNEAGQVVDRTQYEPFGAAIGKPSYDGPGYTGHVMDGATGLTYMQQRYYDPGVGRFLSVDPVTANPKNGGNFNRYWYANNNPYRFTDPDGRLVCNGSGDACRKVDQYVDKIKESKNSPNIKPQEAKQIQKVITYLGKKGEGPTVTPTALPGDTKARTDQRGNIKIDVDKNPKGADATVHGAMALSHEAQHDVYAQSNGEAHTREAATASEKSAYGVEALVGRGLGVSLSPAALDAAVQKSVNNAFGPPPEKPNENP